MNKQALAFISMFTLVLMLSIYYVSLEENTIPNNKPVNDVTSVMALMNEKNNDEKESLILELKEQLGLSTISEAKKIAVLDKIETIQNNQLLETKIAEVLSKENMKSVVCIQDDIVNITMFEIEASKEKAEQIMTFIYKMIQTNQTIEVIFS
ncbi:MAG: hypothetical protein ACI4U3_06795 [Traorella sp.]